LIGAWVAPFVMGPINTRVVRRSAALNAAYRTAYGPRFRYQEYTKLGPPFAAAKAAALAAAMRGFERVMDLEQLVNCLAKSCHGRARVLPKQRWQTAGSRPIWWVARPMAHRAGAHRLRRRSGQPGDAAHPLRVRPRTGVRWGQAAGGSTRGGVLTPATALGEALVPRLRAAGFEISVGD